MAATTTIAQQLKELVENEQTIYNTGRDETLQAVGTTLAALKVYTDSLRGEFESEVLNELHTYAQEKIGGGV